MKVRSNVGTNVLTAARGRLGTDVHLEIHDGYGAIKRWLADIVISAKDAKRLGEWLAPKKRGKEKT